MMRKVCVAGLLVLLVGMVASSSTSVYLTPRVFQTTDGVVYLFDNDTGASQTKLVLILSGPVSLAPSDVTVFGGGEATLITSLYGGTAVYIIVEVLAGGTIQVELSGDNVGRRIRYARFSQ